MALLGSRRALLLRSTVAPLLAAGVMLLGTISTSAAQASVTVKGPAPQGATGAELVDNVTHQIFFVTATSQGTFTVSVTGIIMYVYGPAKGTVVISRGAVNQTVTVGAFGLTTLYTTQFPG